MKDPNSDNIGFNPHQFNKYRLGIFELLMKFTPRQREAYTNFMAIEHVEILLPKRDEALLAVYKPKGKKVDVGHLRKRYRKDREIYEKECLPIIERESASVIAHEVCYRSRRNPAIKTEYIKEMCYGDAHLASLVAEEIIKTGYFLPDGNGDFKFAGSMIPFSCHALGRERLCDWARSYYADGIVTTKDALCVARFSMRLGTRGQNAVKDYLHFAEHPDHAIRKLLRELEAESKKRSGASYHPHTVGGIFVFAKTPKAKRTTIDELLAYVFNEPHPLHFPRIAEYFLDEKAIEKLQKVIFREITANLEKKFEAVETDLDAKNCSKDLADYFVTVHFTKIKS